MVEINLTADETDDVAFVSFAAQIINGAVTTHQPADVRIFKIDHWFDHKWLGFSGRVLGAVGVWSKQLTIPPFVANRIVDQWQYERDEASGALQMTGPGLNIHHRGWTAENLHRRVTQIVPNTALFWYSGDTVATGRGSLMAYIPVEGEDDLSRRRSSDGAVWSWFLAFARDSDWRISRRKSIHEYEVQLFQTAGEKPLSLTADNT